MKDISSASQFPYCVRELVVFVEYFFTVNLLSLLLITSRSADYHSLYTANCQTDKITSLKELKGLPSPIDGSMDGGEVQWEYDCAFLLAQCILFYFSGSRKNAERK